MIEGEKSARLWLRRFATQEGRDRLRRDGPGVFRSNRKGLSYSTEIVKVVLGEEFTGHADVMDFWFPLVDNIRQLNQEVNQEFARGFLDAATA